MTIKVVCPRPCRNLLVDEAMPEFQCSFLVLGESCKREAARPVSIRYVLVADRSVRIIVTHDWVSLNARRDVDDGMRIPPLCCSRR